LFGVVTLFVNVLFPTWPNKLSPQTHNVPSVLIAMVFLSPAITFNQLVCVPICIGIGLL
jgi:hypothetical protein